MASSPQADKNITSSKSLLDYALYALMVYSVLFFALDYLGVSPKRLQGAPQLFFLLATCLVIWRSRLPCQSFGLHLRKIGEEVLVGLIIATVPITIAIAFALSLGVQFSVWPQFLRQVMTTTFAWHLFVIVILAPISEELFFRGVLTTALAQKLRPLWVILFVAILFMLAHFALMLGPFVLGLATTALYLWRRSVISCILLHMLCNALGPLLINFAPDAFAKLRIFFL